MPDTLDLSKIPGLGSETPQPTEDRLDLSKIPGMDQQSTGHVHPWLAAGARGLAGLLGMEGGWTGAGVGALGETAAEMLEKGTIDPSQVDPRRVAAESAISAVPLAKVFQAGRPVYSAVRGAMMGAGGAGLRELAEGGVGALDPSQIALGGAIGGATGGGLAKLFGGAAKTAPTVESAVKPSPATIVPTAQTIPERVIRPSGEALPTLAPRTPEEIAADLTRYQEKTPYAAQPPAAYRAAAKAADKAAIQAAKQRAEQAAQQRIEQTIADYGMEPQAPSIGESASGKLSMRIPYKTPETNIDELLGGSPTPQAAPAPVPGPEGPEASVAKFFRTPQGAAGANYRAAQEAAAAGEIPSAQAARGSRLLTIPGREAEGLTELKGALSKAPSELPETVSPKLAAETPVAAGGPEAPAPSTTGTSIARPMTDAEIATQDRIVNEVAQMPGDFKTNMLNRLQSESGQISPYLLKKLAGMTIGGAAGAGYGAYEDEDDPLAGALKYGTVGSLVGGWVTPTEGETLSKNMLDLHRASLLTGVSPQLKKAIGDPSAMFWEGLKQALPGPYGDPKVGRELMKQAATFYLQPQTYKDILQAMRGGRATPGLTGALRDIYATGSEGAVPGMMAAGGAAPETGGAPLGMATLGFRGLGEATQKAFERAGEYDPNVPLKAMGMSTPETQTGRQALGAIQRNPLLKWLVPFSKLPINVAEGVRNIPGIAQMAKVPYAGQTSMIGGTQMALGVIQELYNQAREDEGDPVGPLTRAAETAIAGVPGVAPIVAGRALTALTTDAPASHLRDLLHLIPGTQTFPETRPNETVRQYVHRLMQSGITEVAPTFLSPDFGTEPLVR